MGEIRDRHEERDGLEAERAAIDLELAALEPGGAAGGAELHYAIRRTMAGGALRFAAEPATRLAPGDVVTVSIAVPGQLATVATPILPARFSPSQETDHE
jgi:hypothetical protein